MSEETEKVYSEVEIAAEQAAALKKGTAYGWTNSTEGAKQIIKATAEAMTKAGFGDFKVEDFRSRAPVGVITAIRITNSQDNSLSNFWRVVDEIRENIGGYQIGQIEEEKLSKAVAKAIEDKKSGVLDRKYRELERKYLRDAWERLGLEFDF